MQEYNDTTVLNKYINIMQEYNDINIININQENLTLK